MRLSFSVVITVFLVGCSQALPLFPRLSALTPEIAKRESEHGSPASAIVKREPQPGLVGGATALLEPIPVVGSLVDGLMGTVGSLDGVLGDVGSLVTFLVKRDTSRQAENEANFAWSHFIKSAHKTGLFKLSSASKIVPHAKASAHTNRPLSTQLREQGRFLANQVCSQARSATRQNCYRKLSAISF